MFRHVALLLALVCSTTWARADIQSSATWNLFDPLLGSETVSRDSAGPLTLQGVTVVTDYGVHKLTVTGTTFAANLTTQGVASSSWTDVFTVNGSSGSGVATAWMSMDGDLLASALSPTAGADLSICFGPVSIPCSSSAFMELQNTELLGPKVNRFQAGTYLDDGLRLDATQFIDTVSLPDTQFRAGETFLVSVPFEFTYGQPFEFTSQATVIASAGGQAMLGSTLVSGFTLPNGAVLSSASGATFAVGTVPEASSWTMTLVGVGLLAFVVRRNRRMDQR